jgi:dihydropyrimidinase
VGGTIISSMGSWEGDVGIAGGRIVAIGRDLSVSGADVIDASGCLVLPGVVDAHVHPIHAETMETISEAAIYGGVTTLLHHIYVDPGRGLIETLEAAREEGEATSLVDFGLHARLAHVRDRLAELPEAISMGVGSFKLFTAYRSRGVMSEDSELFLAMERIGALGGLAMTHAENGAIIDEVEARFRADGRVRAEDYPDTRPVAAEAEAVNRVAAIARITRCPLYVVHISSAEALTALITARIRGQEVYAETCPHYLVWTAGEAMPRFGARAKIAPPLRSRSDVDELWRAVADGRIDVVASDHSAFAPEEKDTEGILEAGFGAPGTETMLSIVYEEGVYAERIRLERLVAVLAEAPARIFGLRTKGFIAPGKDADIVVFDPRTTSVLTDRQHGRAYYSLYAGMTVHGRPRIVLRRGKRVLDGAGLVRTSERGSFMASSHARELRHGGSVDARRKV